MYEYLLTYVRIVEGKGYGGTLSSTIYNNNITLPSPCFHSSLSFSLYLTLRELASYILLLYIKLLLKKVVVSF